MSAISAIETTYRGVRFRSRLEARWAVVFDALHIEWQHEPEAYHLEPFHQVSEDWDGNEVIGETLYPGLNYLPDFHLPRLNAFFEVKGTDPGGLYQTQLAQLGRLTGKQVLLAVGEIPDNVSADHIYQLAPYWDNYFEFARCPKCRTIGCVFSGYSDRLCSCFDGTKGGGGSDEVEQAYQAARGYRFWEPAR